VDKIANKMFRFLRKINSTPSIFICFAEIHRISKFTLPTSYYMLYGSLPLQSFLALEKKEIRFLSLFRSIARIKSTRSQL